MKFEPQSEVWGLDIKMTDILSKNRSPVNSFIIFPVIYFLKHFNQNILQKFSMLILACS